LPKGARYRINLPRFQYDEADQEEKNVDEAIVAYQTGKILMNRTPTSHSHKHSLSNKPRLPPIDDLISKP